MNYQQITDRLKQIRETQEDLELEKDFLYDQLIEMRLMAEDMMSSALELMNDGEQHV